MGKNKTSSDNSNNNEAVTTPKAKAPPKSPSNNKPQTPKTPQANTPSTPNNKTPKEKQNQPITPKSNKKNDKPQPNTPKQQTPSKPQTPKPNNNNNNNDKPKQATPKQQTPSKPQTPSNKSKVNDKKTDSPHPSTPIHKNQNDNMEVVKENSAQTPNQKKKNKNKNKNKTEETQITDTKNKESNNKPKTPVANNNNNNNANNTNNNANNNSENNNSVNKKKKRKKAKRNHEEMENGGANNSNNNSNNNYSSHNYPNKRQKRVYTIVVQNFAPMETKDSLEKLFGVCGTVTDVRLKRDIGLCFIDFEDLGGYEAALNLNQSTVNNAVIKVTGSYCTYSQSFPPSKYLFVSNLSTNTTEKDLVELFRKFGQIDRVELVKDKISGLSRGFGFIVLNSIAAAQSAISLSGTFYKNRVLRIEFHAPRFDKIVDGKVKVSLVDVHQRRKSRLKRELRDSATFTLTPDDKEFEENFEAILEQERQKNKELERERERYRAITMSESDC